MTGPITRRGVFGALGGGLLALAAGGPATAASGIETRPIPSTGERIPVLGMGTWRTFNVGSDATLRAARTEVMRTFLARGGTMVDSSPMYGSAQAVIGHALKRLGAEKQVFSADKIWTSDEGATRADLETARRLWGVERVDLMQVHNLLAWEAHLPALQALKSAGRIRYVGITTSHGRRHADLEAVMKAHRIDFVQLTYNMVDREVERRLLPVAKDRGIAVIVNRPFLGGDLLARLQGRGAKLPPWAKEMGCANWPQFLLRWTLGHPAVTCAIPATSRVEHMLENMAAGRGAQPEPKTRERMSAWLASL